MKRKPLRWGSKKSVFIRQFCQKKLGINVPDSVDRFVVHYLLYNHQTLFYEREKKSKILLPFLLEMLQNDSYLLNLQNKIFKQTIFHLSLSLNLMYFVNSVLLPLIKRVNFRKLDFEKRSIFLCAVMCEDEDLVTYLLSRIKTEEFIFMSDSYGNSALHYACQNENKKITQLLLSRISEGNGRFVLQKNILGKCPLHYYCEMNGSNFDKEILEWFLNIERKVVLVRDFDGKTPMNYATVANSPIKKKITISDNNSDEEM